MTIIEQSDATQSLSDFASRVGDGAVIVTKNGKPVAALVPLDNTDLETATLSNSRQFLDLIERSRARVAAEGGIPVADVRRLVG